ncbi:unnamed protein product [Prunus brigantina]
MVDVDDDQFGKLKTPNPSDDQSLIGRPRNEDGDRKVSEGSKRKRQLMRIKILPLVLSNDSEVSGDDFEGGVHGGGRGRRRKAWVIWFAGGGGNSGFGFASPGWWLGWIFLAVRFGRLGLSILRGGPQALVDDVRSVRWEEKDRG